MIRWLVLFIFVYIGRMQNLTSCQWYAQTKIGSFMQYFQNSITGPCQYLYLNMQGQTIKQKQSILQSISMKQTLVDELKLQKDQYKSELIIILFDIMIPQNQKHHNIYIECSNIKNQRDNQTKPRKCMINSIFIDKNSKTKQAQKYINDYRVQVLYENQRSINFRIFLEKNSIYSPNQQDIYLQVEFINKTIKPTKLLMMQPIKNGIIQQNQNKNRFQYIESLSYMLSFSFLCLSVFYSAKIDIVDKLIILQKYSYLYLQLIIMCIRIFIYHCSSALMFIDIRFRGISQNLQQVTNDRIFAGCSSISIKYYGKLIVDISDLLTELTKQTFYPFILLLTLISFFSSLRSIKYFIFDGSIKCKKQYFGNIFILKITKNNFLKNLNYPTQESEAIRTTKSENIIKLVFILTLNYFFQNVFQKYQVINYLGLFLVNYGISYCYQTPLTSVIANKVSEIGPKNIYKQKQRNRTLQIRRQLVFPKKMIYTFMYLIAFQVTYINKKPDYLIDQKTTIIQILLPIVVIGFCLILTYYYQRSYLDKKVQIIKSNEIKEQLKIQKCLICFQQLDQQNQTDNYNILLKTECGHIFHAICLLNWYVQKYSCPVDRNFLDMSKQLKTKFVINQKNNNEQQEQQNLEQQSVQTEQQEQQNSGDEQVDQNSQIDSCEYNQSQSASQNLYDQSEQYSNQSTNQST